MPSKITGAGLFMAAGIFLPTLCAANGFKTMAKEFSRAAENADIKRVAILPFMPADDSHPKDGWNISEKLVTQVVRVGKIQTVERSLLRNLMEEHHMAQTGMMDPASLKKIGKILSVDGIIAGSFVALGNEVVVNARLINAENGLIIAAIERRVDRDWFAASAQAPEKLTASLWMSAPDLSVTAPEFPVEAPPLPSANPPDLHDAPNDSCSGAAERIDRYESEIMDLKARYWAAQLKKGVSLADVKVNPGSTISDPLLKEAFYERMQYYYGLQDVPALTSYEIQRFVFIDEKAYSLYRECGV